MLKKLIPLFLAISMSSNFIGPILAQEEFIEEIIEEDELIEEEEFEEDEIVVENTAYNDFEYTILDGGIQITAYTGSDSNVIIPSKINGYVVNNIGEHAFLNNENLESITIPESIQKIEKEAFEGTVNLSTIYFNAIECSDVIAMDNVFKNTGANQDTCRVIFGNQVTQIPANLFYTDQMETEEYAHITNVTLSSGITDIGEYAFGLCWGLKEVDFSQATNLSKIYSYAFADCKSLTSITIPESVTYIGEHVFLDTQNVSNIYFNAKACKNTTILGGVFLGVGYSTESCTVTFGKEVTRIPANLFYCDSQNYYAFITEVIMSDSITEIGSSAFENCGSLSEVVWGSNLNTLGNFAFNSCKNLESIVLPVSVTKLGNYCFGDCEKLSSITFQSEVPAMGNNTFENDTLDGYYPIGLNGWSDAIKKVYGAEDINWISYTIPIQEVVLDSIRITIPKGESRLLTATILPTNTTDAKTLTWSTKDSSIASVNASGKVTGKSIGKTTITVKTSTGKSAVCEVEVTKPADKPMYRLYNRSSGEHLYTLDKSESDLLVKYGWKYEGVAWYSPAESSTPVYRLYNPNNGDHHYTTDKSEYDLLKGYGWKQEGISFYSDDEEGTPVYRLFNSHARVGTHHYTKDKEEYDLLPKYGWTQEGTAWYGVKE